MGQAYRDLKRYHQIIFVLVKYGFGDLIETLRLDKISADFFPPRAKAAGQ